MDNNYIKSRNLIAKEYDNLLTKFKGSHKSLKTYDLKKAKRKYEIVSSNIGKNDVILDVGCGTGNLIKFLANKHISKPDNYHGIDFSKKMYQFCKAKYPNYNFYNADILESDKNSPYYFKNNKKFDSVVCLSTIQQKPLYISTEKYINLNISKFYDLTKKNGVIIFDIFYDKFIDFKDKNLNYLSINKISSICHNFTYSIKMDFTISPYEAIIIMKKI